LSIHYPHNPSLQKKASLRISNQNFIHARNAFTLIELIVVMALMSILLFFAVPRLDINIFSDDQRDFSTWIIFTVKSLKEISQQEGVHYTLYVDMDNDMFWSGRETEEEELEPQKENQYKLADGFQLMDVMLLDAEEQSSGIAEIHFYPKGYSDKAVIHIRDDDNNRNSYVIEPFLSQVKIYDRYHEF
jgi:prepilin-type N-terminal cleavage/methylation domain-containing protein